MIGEMTRKAFEAWLVGDEAWRQYGEMHIHDGEGPANGDTLKTRLLLASSMVDALAENEGIRAVVFRGDGGGDDVGVPQFETHFAHGEVDSRFGDLDLGLAQLDLMPCFDAKLAFKAFIDFLRHAVFENGEQDFQSVMLYLRSQPCSVRTAMKDCKLYAIRVVGSKQSHPEFLPWVFETESRARHALKQLVKSVVSNNSDNPSILEDRDVYVIGKIPLMLRIVTINAPKNFTAVRNAEGDWFVGNLNHMRTKNWYTRDWTGAQWLERLNPYHYQAVGIEDHKEWSCCVEDAAAKCDWWKIELADLDVWQWLFVLRFRPDFAKICPYWEEFDPFQWSLLLRRQPKFAVRCNRFNDFNPDIWSFLLSRQPQFADRCTCWNDMYPAAWERLLKAQPQFLERIDLDHAPGALWAKVVKCFPDRAKDCPWDRLNACDWAELLSECPDFSGYCDFSKFDGHAWSCFLADAPQFIDRCNDVAMISASDWYAMLRAQPQLARHFQRWNELESEQVLELLRRTNNKMCEFVDFASLPLETRIQCVIQCPAFRSQMVWQDVGAKDWLRLIDDNSMFANDCTQHFQITDDLGVDLFVRLTDAAPKLKINSYLSKRNSRELSRILLESKREWDPFPYDAIVGSDWVDVLLGRPYLLEKCDRNKLQEGDLVRLLTQRPELACHFNVDSLDGDAIVKIILNNEEFARNYTNWNLLTGADWLQLLMCNKANQYAQYCDWTSLNVDDWFQLLTRQDQYADKCTVWDAFNEKRRESLRNRWPKNKMIHGMMRKV